MNLPLGLKLRLEHYLRCLGTEYTPDRAVAVALEEWLDKVEPTGWRKRCAWCYMDIGDAGNSGGTSHGICLECRDEFFCRDEPDNGGK